jgi:hypothetical protein
LKSIADERLAENSVRCLDVGYREAKVSEQRRSSVCDMISCSQEATPDRCSDQKWATGVVGNVGDGMRVAPPRTPSAGVLWFFGCATDEFGRVQRSQCDRARPREPSNQHGLEKQSYPTTF